MNLRANQAHVPVKDVLLLPLRHSDIRPDPDPVTSNDRSIDLIFQLTMRGEVDAGQ
jgi:hypothetical protein